MNYYPHHIGDFNSATRHLTRTERSIYRDLIDLYYDTEAPLVADMAKLCRLVLAHSEEERTAVEQVLNEFFTETEQGWSHARCDIEISKYHGNKEAKSAAGKASAAKRTAKSPSKPIISSTPDEQPNNECSTGVQHLLNRCATNQNQEPEPITKSQIKEPSSPRKRGSGFDAAAIDLPDWLPEAAWQQWVQDRKDRKKPITQLAAKNQIDQLDEYRKAGHTPESVLKHCIAGGYAGLFPPNHRIGQVAGNVVPLNRQEALEQRNNEIGRRWAEGRS